MAPHTNDDDLHHLEVEGDRILVMLTSPQRQALSRRLWFLLVFVYLSGVLTGILAVVLLGLVYSWFWL